MSRIEYSWQVALQQSLLPLPRSTQVTRVSMFDLSAIHRPVLAFSGTVIREFRFPIHPTVCFKARPVYSHSIDVCSTLFPQMDVWPRCLCVGLVKGSRTVRNTNYLPTRRTYSAESRGISVSVDFYLSWTSPNPVTCQRILRHRILQTVDRLRNVQFAGAHGTRRVAPSVLEHGLDLHPEMPIPNRRGRGVHRSGHLVVVTMLLGLFADGADSFCQQRQSERRALPTLTKAHDAHSLTSEQAARSYPVHLRTVVTYYDPYIDPRHPTVWVSDSSGGIYVELSSVPAVPFQAGDLIEITGVSAAGGYAPIVKAREARVIGRSPLPATPPKVTLAQILTGAEDGQWVEVEGVVHAVRESGKNIALDVALSDGTVTATTLKEVGADYDSLVDAKVRLRGNQAPLFNHQGAMTGAYLLFPDRAQVTVVEPAPAYPFTLPISPVSGLLRFTPEPPSNHRVHVRGTVTLAWLGRLLCIQDGLQSLCAQTAQTTPLSPGELADLIGFPIIGAFTPTLTSATYKAAGFQRSARPVAVTADQALHGNHDAELVELEGQLVGQDETAGHTNVVLSSQNQVFAAVLPAQSGMSLPAWKKGSTLKVVGICSMKGGPDRAGIAWDGFSIPESFRILLRSPQDVVVIKSPSWWTPTHAISTLGLATALTLAVLAWVFVLRKRVDEQTHIIRQQLQEAAKLGFEIRTLNEDLEERIAKRTEQLEATNHELEAFSYSVSHDLRSPLRHIAGFSRILVNDFGAVMAVGAREHLQQIEDAVHRMERMVEALLKMAVLRRRSLQLRHSELNSIVDEVIAMLQPECEGREVEWRIAKLPALDCDPVLMAQVFQNLLGNALKYSRGRASAVIEVDSITRPGKPAIIFVRDNGVGFNMKYAEGLFGVFQRFHSDSEFEGTGVGLATVHRIIQKHGGIIWAEAEPDHGATFYFALQLTEQIGTTLKATAAS
jgi:signal transduction histidine kinase